MKAQISPFQLSIIIANFIFASSLMSLPQVLIEVSNHNTWLVVCLAFPIINLMVFILLKNNKKLENIKRLFDPEQQSTPISKSFVILILLFLLLIFIRDFRAFVDFINTILLPETPLNVIAILSIICLMYISFAGVEVIARVTVIHFIPFFSLVLFVPLALINGIEVTNFLPLGGMNSVPEILKSTMLLLPWMGEVVILVLLFVYVKPIEKILKASFIGIGLGFISLLLNILLNISVLGLGVAKESTYPGMVLVQQIHLTDFLDRLDLVIVVIWLPAMISKLALILYGIHKCLNVVKGNESNLLLLPLGLMLALTINLFTNTIDHLEFSFFTWGVLGIFMEVLLVVFFMLIKYKQKPFNSLGS